MKRVQPASTGKTIMCKAFAIPKYLSSRPGEMVIREELPNDVWDYETFPMTRTVDNHIEGIRAKLEQGEPKQLTTVRGVGYNFVF